MNIHESYNDRFSCNQAHTVNVLKYQTLVTAKNHKLCLIRVFSVLLFWQAFCESNIRFENRKRKVFEILEHLP